MRRRYGSYVKKEEYLKEALNPKTQQQARPPYQRALCAPGGAARARDGRRRTRTTPRPATAWQVLARRTRSVERSFELPEDAEACDFLLSRFWAPTTSSAQQQAAPMSTQGAT